ncbi:Tex family protein [Marinomonas posidonica]|uniref:Tex-like protein n=1 Tax=Marinomonas posidonica (strain CECT 7376 / NCIMB 14433 / IVIA-Po-181) TaxID=491952 RepID=F6CZ45_MARPP|nr:Tex family protein [Marinomonas posidonica]AEF53501.1 Tex-like protein [Marinomonas posidonica IVIA-Po-181]
MKGISQILSDEFSLSIQYSGNIIDLFEEGASVPFIARYRKENTGGMSDIQLRAFYERWQYLVELNKRRDNILSSLSKDSNVPELVNQKIRNAMSKTELEDIYAPYKKSRKSKMGEAIAKGLMPLAVALWQGRCLSDVAKVAIWCQQNKLNLDSTMALQGAQDILIETISTDSDLLKVARQAMMKQGVITSRVLRGKKQEGEKFRDYFEYEEAVSKVVSHRLLALFRGKKANILKLGVVFKGQVDCPNFLYLSHLTRLFDGNQKSASLSTIQMYYVYLAWQTKLQAKLETDVLAQLKDKAEDGAIQVFANNLEDLLMAAPAGAHRVIGVDPGFRNGVKLAVIDEQGNVLDYGVIYPHAPQNQVQAAQQKLSQLIQQHQIRWAAIGNGTASRETEALLKDLIATEGLSCQAVVVSEAGASVYSASPLASAEFPDLDVTIRGAISIARRFQDPLAELVKIDPQAIGVGQYQHDIKVSALSTSLTNVVEDCVNRVGVDINLASASLLSYVSGLSDRIAQNIVAYRESKGRIESRTELKKVKGIGDKCFEQCAGFLRILNGKEPLDASGVHPESYALVRSMAVKLALTSRELLNNNVALQQLKTLAPSFQNAGDYTYSDILNELDKPGRDPRPEFTYAAFDQSIQSLDDLHEGMTLEGVVTNVAAFGAFVDLGVHQDGLIHISQLADRFVKDPRDLVRVGQVVKVMVLEVDVKRKRIALKAQGL